MSESPPSVSVVTPFYNTEAFLAECIESVLNQTFQDFEYILVDNHSTDRSREIAERYASIDDRIHLTSPEHFLDQADNFNFALRQISSSTEFCKMVLADDWLYPRCLEEMVALGRAHPSAALISSYCLEGAMPLGGGLPVNTEMLPGDQMARIHMLRGCNPFGNPSTVMYRSDVVRTRPGFFDPDQVFFDTDAALWLLTEHDFAFAHQVLSFKRTYEGSVTDRIRSFAPTVADRLIVLRNFGPMFLDDDEYRRCIRPVERQYAAVLGRRWVGDGFRVRDTDFWIHQRRCHASMGRIIGCWGLVRGVGWAAAQALAYPLTTYREARAARL